MAKTDIAILTWLGRRRKSLAQQEREREREGARSAIVNNRAVTGKEKPEWESIGSSTIEYMDMFVARILA